MSTKRRVNAGGGVSRSIGYSLINELLQLFQVRQASKEITARRAIEFDRASECARNMTCHRFNDSRVIIIEPDRFRSNKARGPQPKPQSQNQWCAQASLQTARLRVEALLTKSSRAIGIRRWFAGLAATQPLSRWPRASLCPRIDNPESPTTMARYEFVRGPYRRGRRHRRRLAQSSEMFRDNIAGVTKSDFASQANQPIHRPSASRLRPQ